MNSRSRLARHYRMLLEARARSAGRLAALNVRIDKTTPPGNGTIAAGSEPSSAASSAASASSTAPLGNRKPARIRFNQHVYHIGGIDVDRRGLEPDGAWCLSIESVYTPIRSGPK